MLLVPEALAQFGNEFVGEGPEGDDIAISALGSALLSDRVEAGREDLACFIAAPARLRERDG